MAITPPKKGTSVYKPSPPLPSVKQTNRPYPAGQIKQRNDVAPKNGKKRRFSLTRKVPNFSNIDSGKAGQKIAELAINRFFMFFLLGFNIIKDLLDLLFFFLNSTGIATSATVVGAAIGVALIAFASLTNMFMSMFLFFINMTFFVVEFFTSRQMFENLQKTSDNNPPQPPPQATKKPSFLGKIVKGKAHAVLQTQTQKMVAQLRKRFTRRLTIMSITAILGAIPIINILPESTIGYLFALFTGAISHAVEKRREKKNRA